MFYYFYYFVSYQMQVKDKEGSNYREYLICIPNTHPIRARGPSILSSHP